MLKYVISFLPRMLRVCKPLEKKIFFLKNKKKLILVLYKGGIVPEIFLPIKQMVGKIGGVVLKKEKYQLFS